LNTHTAERDAVDMPQPHLLDVTRAARRLGCAVALVERLVVRGAFPHAKLTKYGARIPVADVVALRSKLKVNTARAGAPPPKAPRFTSTCRLPWCDEPARGTGGCLCEGHQAYLARCKRRGIEPDYKPIEKVEPPKVRFLSLASQLVETDSEDDGAFKKNEEALWRCGDTVYKSKGWRPPSARCPVSGAKCVAVGACG
jgi:hypothetical protein